MTSQSGLISDSQGAMYLKGRKLKKLCIAAAVLTFVFAAIDIGLELTMVVYHYCGASVNKPPLDGTAMGYFYQNYVAITSVGDGCDYKDGTAVATEWLCCKGSSLETCVQDRKATTANGTNIWIIIHFALDVIWITSAIFLFFGGTKLSTDLKNCDSKVL